MPSSATVLSDNDRAVNRAKTLFMRDHQMLTQEQLNNRVCLKTSCDTVEHLRKWQARDTAVAVNWKGEIYYPVFQFETDGTLNPTICEIASLFRTGREYAATDWSFALWLTSPHPWLNGDAPIDCLDTPEKVIQAADRTFNCIT